MKVNTPVKITKGAHKGKQGKIGANRPSNGHQRGKLPVIVGHKNDIYWVQPDWLSSNEAPILSTDQIEVSGNVEETTVDEAESLLVSETLLAPVMVSNETVMINAEAPGQELLVEAPVFNPNEPPLKHDLKPGKQWLDPRLVIIKGGTQSRDVPEVYQVSVQRVQQYAETMRGAGLWDWYREPLPVAFLTEEGEIFAGDCHHRVSSCMVTGHKIYIDLRPGSKTDAILFSCRSNTDHGLALRPKDQRRRVEMLLNTLDNLPQEKVRELLKTVPGITQNEIERAPEIGWSARVIAKFLRMNESGHRTVINILQERKRAVIFKEMGLTIGDYVKVLDEWVGKIHELSVRKGIFVTPISKTCCNGKFLEGNYVDPSLVEKIENSSDVETLNSISDAASKGELTSISEELKRKAEELGVPFDGLPEVPRNEGDPTTLEAPAPIAEVEDATDIVAEVENSVDLLTDEEIAKIWKAISGRVQMLGERVNA